MTERRTLLALLLIVLTVVFYIWGKRSASVENPRPPEKVEAGERAKAEPFPAPEERKQ